VAVMLWPSHNGLPHLSASSFSSLQFAGDLQEGQRTVGASGQDMFIAKTSTLP